MDPVRASEEFDHLGGLLDHFNDTVSKPTRYQLASDTDEFELDDFRAALVDYCQKAIAARRSKVRLRPTMLALVNLLVRRPLKGKRRRWEISTSFSFVMISKALTIETNGGV